MLTGTFPLFVLDSLRSAFNVGSIFRTAESISPCGVVLCGITARPGGRKVGHTSRGTHASVPWRWYETSSLAAAAISVNRAVIAVENTPDAVPLHEAFIPPGAAFIMGSEADGVSPDTLDICRYRVAIPQSGSRKCINVSSTAAMVAWEIQRRRLSGETI